MHPNALLIDINTLLFLDMYLIEWHATMSYHNTLNINIKKSVKVQATSIHICAS